MRVATLLRKPTAFLPPLMSVAALGLVIGFLLKNGVERQPDEGLAAHVWQLLMALQVPVIAVFIARWLRESPRSALMVLLIQLAAGLAAAAPVFLLGF